MNTHRKYCVSSDTKNNLKKKEINAMENNIN